MSDECTKVTSSLSQMQREKQRDADIIDSLKKVREHLVYMELYML